MSNANSPGGAGRSIVFISGAIVVVVAAAVVGVLLVDSEPQSFPEGTPERAFQSYLQAYESRDYQEAYSYFSNDVQSRLTADRYATDATSGPGRLDNMRVRIDRAERNGDRVTLFISIERSFGDGLDRDRYAETREIPMVNEDERWRIDVPMLGADPAPWLERAR